MGRALESREPFDPADLLRALDAFANREAQISERFYELFFERRPDTRELFGVHAIAEREEMMRETFRSVHALLEGQEWLVGNLVALGSSHWEYGVTEDMYLSFVDTLIDCGREVLGDEIDDGSLASLRMATTWIAGQMSLAGDAAAKRRDPPTSEPTGVD